MIIIIIIGTATIFDVHNVNDIDKCLTLKISEQFLEQQIAKPDDRLPATYAENGYRYDYKLSVLANLVIISLFF